MANAHHSLKSRTQQKSQALRMLLTSGVIRGANVDPPGISDPRFQRNPTRSIYTGRMVHANPVHATGHRRHLELFTQWHSTFVDILKEFGKR